MKHHRFFIPVMIVILVMAAVLTPVFGAPSAYTATCPAGLQVSGTVEFNANTASFKLTGTGPGLPSSTITFAGASGTDITKPVTWVLKGGGSWNFHLERAVEHGFWKSFFFKSGPTLTCVEFSEAGPPAMNLYDGRINNSQNHDVAAPVAIYEGSIKVYGIDPASGEGRLSVDISDEAIDAAGVPTDAPVLLGEGVNSFTGIEIAVYRLTSGEFQLNTRYADGKDYIVVWNEARTSLYHLAW